MQGYINLKSCPLQKPLVVQRFCWSYMEVNKYKLNLKCFVYLHSTIFSLDFGNIPKQGHRSAPESGREVCKGIGNCGGKLCKWAWNWKRNVKIAYPNIHHFGYEQDYDCFCFLKSSKNNRVLYLIMCSKSFQKIFLSILKYYDIFDKSSIFESEMYTETNMASCVCY